MNAPSTSSFPKPPGAALSVAAFLVPAVGLVCWLLSDVRPDVFLRVLYDRELPFAFRLPLVALCASGLAAWACLKLRMPELSPSRCVRSPRRVAGVALLALAVVFSAAFGREGLWTIASLLCGVALLEAACGVGLLALLLPPLNLAGRFRGRAAEQYVLASALGLGLIALAVFVAGSAGVLHRAVWLIALAVVLVLSAGARARLGVALENGFLEHVRRAHPAALGALFFVLAWYALQSPLVTGASLEYDVLEYHLAAPLQYLRDGRITFLRENVYAAMPASAEMLFLVPLSFFDDPYRGIYGARVVLWGAWALSALGVYALTARLTAGSNAGDEAPGVAPIFAAGLFALAPMGSHLAADFYVEHPQTLFHVTAILAACNFFQDRRLGVRDRFGWLIACGILAGACCATKYAGLLLTLGPLLLCIPLLCAIGGSLFEGLRAALVLAIPALFITAPWALRNLIAGGDPLYPLGLVLQRRDAPVTDSPDHLDHLEVALRTGERSMSALGRTLVEFWPPFSAYDEEAGGLGRWVKDAELGPHLLAGLPLALLSLATPEALLVALVTLADAAIWFLFSHRVERFFFPILPLLAVLSGVALAQLWRSRPARKIAVVFVCVSALGMAPLGMLYVYSLSRPHALLGEADPLESQLEQYAQTGNRPWAEAWRTINTLPEGSRVLFIGDAQTAYVRPGVTYHVVFNPSLLEEALRGASKAEDVALYLKAHGVTHLYFNYAEWLRLDTSYALSAPSPGARWEYAQVQPPERMLLWQALTSRQFGLYGKSWMPGVKPAYLKLTAGHYALLEELVRAHSGPHKTIYGSKQNVLAEIRSLN